MKVTITHRPKSIAVSPDPAYVKQDGKDEIVWECSTGEAFSVDFKNETPFTGKHFDQGSSHSKAVQKEAKKQYPYKYSVKIGSDVIDPAIIVN